MKCIRLFSCLILGLAMALGLLPGCSRSKTPTEAADAFLSSVSQGDYEKAYESSSFAFHTAQTFSTFEVNAKELNLAKQGQVSNWTRKVIEGDEAKLDGTMLLSSGSNIDTAVTLLHEKGEWKVFTVCTLDPTKPGIYENRFSIVGKGVAFSTAAARPMPSEDAIRELVADSLVKFNEAVQKRSFADFYHEVSYSWQQQLTLRQLQSAFQPFINASVNLGAIRTFQAVFDTPPQINSEGVLLVKGRYPQKGYSIYFSLKFVYELPKWRLLGIDVQLKK